MFDNQALVAQLAMLGHHEEAKRVAEEDIKQDVERLKERMKKAKVDSKVFESAEFNNKLVSQQRVKYQEIIAKIKQDGSDENKAADKGRNEKKRDDKQDTEAKKREQVKKQVTDGSEHTITQLENIVEDAYGAVYDYCATFRQLSEKDGSSFDVEPFKKHFDLFRLTVQRSRTSISPEIVEITIDQNVMENVDVDNAKALLKTPLGSFLRVGELRSGVIELHDKSKADVCSWAALPNRTAFEDALQDEVVDAVLDEEAE